MTRREFFLPQLLHSLMRNYEDARRSLGIRGMADSDKTINSALRGSKKILYMWGGMEEWPQTLWT